MIHGRGKRVMLTDQVDDIRAKGEGLTMTARAATGPDEGVRRHHLISSLAPRPGGAGRLHPLDDQAHPDQAPGSCDNGTYATIARPLVQWPASPAAPGSDRPGRCRRPDLVASEPHQVAPAASTRHLAARPVARTKEKIIIPSTIVSAPKTNHNPLISLTNPLRQKTAKKSGKSAPRTCNKAVQVIAGVST
jgi:hypothetical protein